MRFKQDVKLLYSSDLLDGFLIKNKNNADSIITNLIMNLSPVDSDKHEKREFL